MGKTRIRCALVLIDDDDRTVQLLARLSRADSYAVAMTVGRGAAARRRDVRMLARLLRHEGYSVDLSVGDWAALECFTRPPRPNVLLLDVDAQLAVTADLVRRIRALSPELPVIVLSDRAREVTEALAELDPAALVLQKPFDYGELRELLLDARPRSTSAIVTLSGARSEPRPYVGRHRR